MKKLFYIVTFLFFCTGCSAEISNSDSTIPEILPFIISSGFVNEPLESSDILSLSCYNGTATAILKDGSIVLWGSNVFAGIGNGEIDVGNPGTPVNPYRHDFGRPILETGSMTSSYALTFDGELYMWGENLYNETGIEYAPILTPTKIELDFTVAQVSIMPAFTLLLTDMGEVYHAGFPIETLDRFDDYEHNNENVSKVNKQFKKLELDFLCQKIDSSVTSYVFLTLEGEVYIQGVLMGDVHREADDLVFNSPTLIDFPERIVDIAALATNTVAVSESGSVYVFGRPNAGLSDESVDELIDEFIYKKELDFPVESVQGTESIAVIVGKNGMAYSWGVDWDGLIEGSAESENNANYNIISTPVNLGYTNVSNIVIGVYTGAVITGDGDVKMWGNNLIGQVLEFN